MAKVLFLQNIVYDYLGTMMLSASLKQAGHACRVISGNNFGSIRKSLLRDPPDIVAFSLMSGLHLWAKEITSEIRKLELRKQPFVIYGGPHPTFFPNILADSEADAICIGEGELAIVELANAIDAKQEPRGISNLWIKTPQGIERNPLSPLADLDSLPFPDRELYYGSWFFRSEPTKTFMAGRGCPFNCTFCYNRTIKELYKGKGAFVRLRSADNLIAEIKSVQKQWGLKTVFFFDDTFGIEKRWTLDFLQHYRNEVRLPFMCRVRANSIDEEMVAAFKESGCQTLFFAVETANERIREQILKKRVSDEDIRRAAAWFHKYKIKFFTYNMVGIPEETIDDIYSTIQLNVDIGTSYPWCSIFSPYPGTELADYCIEKGYLSAGYSPDDLGTTYHLAALNNLPDHRMVSNLHKFFALAVLCPSLLPLLKRLAKLPPNILFTLVFSVVYFVNYVRSEHRGVFRTLLLACHNALDILGLRRK